MPTRSHSMIFCGQRPARVCRSTCKPTPFFSSLILSFFIFYLTVAAYASPSPPVDDPPGRLYSASSIPSEYGQVIFRVNERSPKQVFIIGISHRDPDNGANNDTSVFTQADVFHIGEWLKRTVNLELLLPEGYFKENNVTSSAMSHVKEADLPVPGINSDLLFEKLNDSSRFVNAEMLLMEHFAMHACQVEDRKIYDQVRETLASLTSDNTSSGASASERMDQLRYLQEIRTAMLLQKIPGAIEREVDKGEIRNRCAMFTIGLYHLQDIIRYIEESAIRVNAPSDAPYGLKSYSAELDLLKQGYGITIIIPRTLAENKNLLRIMNLERSLVAAGEAQSNL